MCRKALPIVNLTWSMVNNVIRLFKRYAWFKRVNAKLTYELLAKKITDPSWQFMNYGYVPKEGEFCSKLTHNHTQQFCVQMYHFLAVKKSMEGKEVLEVGSGRGGGASYLAKTFNPAMYTGMDLAQGAVDLANKTYSQPNLKFIQGSAESIPLPDNSIDIVMNVESCHSYGSVPKFLSEVKRVLKPDGFLLLVDFRNTQENMAIFKKELGDSGLTCLEEEDISPNVIRAIEGENDQKTARIRDLVPPKYQKLFAQFAGVVGSPFHQTLKEGTRTYRRFVLQNV